jgi:hypothetical protein
MKKAEEERLAMAKGVSSWTGKRINPNPENSIRTLEALPCFNSITSGKFP